MGKKERRIWEERFKAMYVRMQREEEYGKERKKNMGRKI